MQLKRTALIWTAVLICMFTGSPNSKAAPVPLDFIDTYSETHAYAEAYVYADIEGYGNNDVWGSWDATAYVYAEGVMQGPPDEYVYAEAWTDALVGYGNMGGVEIYSSLYSYGEVYPMAYGGEFYGQGDTLLQGQLTVGTAAGFPQDASGLTLEVYADGYEYDFYSTWSIYFFSDDPNNPVDETLNYWYEVLSIPVLAGQVLDVDFSHDGDGGGYDYFDGFSDLYVTMTVVPEPVTLSFLALGGLGLLFRRRRA